MNTINLMRYLYIHALDVQIRNSKSVILIISFYFEIDYFTILLLIFQNIITYIH